MASKLEAAQTVVQAGGAVVIANGRMQSVLQRVLDGDDVGTLIVDPERAERRPMSGRQRWIAFFHRASGTLVVDNGARDALEKKGRSLLPIGIARVEGDFQVGAVVNVKTLDARLIARGLVEYTSDQIRTIMGHRTSEIAGLLGARDYDEVIHRDNMVLLAKKKGEIG
jgi:glutamate 5-kinase